MPPSFEAKIRVDKDGIIEIFVDNTCYNDSKISPDMVQAVISEAVFCLKKKGITLGRAEVIKELAKSVGVLVSEL